MSEIERLYEIARADGVVIDRTGRGLLRLTGPQAVWFLQQTITADVEDMPAGTWRESAFLTPKGKLVSHFRVGSDADGLWLDVDPPAGDLADWLVKYRFRTKVDIDDRSGPVSTVLGPPALELAEPGFVVGTTEGVIFGDVLGDVPIADVHSGGRPRTPGHGTLHGEIARAPLDVLEIVRIEAGSPRFGVDYTTENLPQEGGLTRVVPIDKGCYVGQETVARIHFRGHVNKVVRALRLHDVTDDPIGRALTLDDERIGTITSAAVSPRSGHVAIGMVRVEPPEGAEVEIEGGGTAVLGPLPEGTKIKS